MAFKYKTVTVKDATKLLEELRDFLVNDVGWTDNTPAGQDDEMGANNYHGILGYFLNSAGEDGGRDINFHLYTGKQTDLTWNRYEKHVFPAASYVDTGIGVTDGSVDVTDISTFSGLTLPFDIRIGDEYITVSSIAGSTLTFSGRGVYGSAAATHSAGELVLEVSNCGPTVETYGFTDLTTHLDETSGNSDAIGTKSVSPAGAVDLSGYSDDRFNLHAMFKIISGAESGKMRPITNYVDSNGEFSFLEFKNAPGAEDYAVVSMGFLPTFSRRFVDASPSYYRAGRIEVAATGTDTTCWFYASKYSVTVITKLSGTYHVFYAGEVVPFAAFDNASTTSAASAGTNTIDVDDINLFVEDEKYRIMSQDAGDWATNQSRTAPEPDLDPEEIPTEEFVVASITPGVSPAGTLTLTSNLLFDYSSGAVVGEDPRPTARSAPNTYADDQEIPDDDCCWLPVYIPCDKSLLSSHASHRQCARAAHDLGARWTPDVYALYSRAPGWAKGRVGALGGQDTDAEVTHDHNYQTGRPLAGLVSLFQDDSGSSSDYGLFQLAKGVVLGMWFVDLKSGVPPLGGVSEDTYKARWEGGYEVFRLFQTNASGNAWIVCGPEIP